MPNHLVFLPPEVARDLLGFPTDAQLKQARIENNELVFDIETREPLGAEKLDALYGNVEEDSTTVEFGMFTDRS